jgi:hypothetical protein
MRSAHQSLRQQSADFVFSVCLLITSFTGSMAFGQDPDPPSPSTSLPAASPKPSPSVATTPAANTKSEEAEKPRRAPWLAHILRRAPPETRIHELNFSDLSVPVMLVGKGSSIRPLVSIKLSFARPDWALLGQGKPIAIDESGSATVYAYLNGRVGQLNLTAESKTGAVENETIYIFAPDAQEFNIVSSWSALMLGLGLNRWDYFQSLYGNYIAYTTSLVVQYVPESSARFGLLAVGEMSFASISASSSDYSPQLLNAHADATMMVSNFNSRWRHRMLAGVNYLSILSNGSPFGFANLIAPEVGLRSRRPMSSAIDLIGEVRYVPLGDLLRFREYGFDIKVGLNRTLTNLHQAEIAIGFQIFTYQPTSETSVQTATVYLRSLYSF